KCFFFSSRRRHTRFSRDWSSDVCSSDLGIVEDFQYLDIQIGRSGTAVVVQQDLEADGAFDRRQLAVEQGPGQELDIAGQSLVARSEERRVGKESGWSTSL